MRRMSKKRRERYESTREYRNALVEDTKRCMLCGTNPTRRLWGVAELNNLCCHEILNGPDRQKVLDEPSCLIVACWKCNGNDLEDKKTWPLARQLALIKVKAPERYDRERVMFLRNPNAPNFVTEGEVDAYLRAEDREGKKD